MIAVSKLRGRWTEYGYKQYEVASYLGVGADTFSGWMKKAKLDSDYIVKLAKLLEIEDYNYFFVDRFDSEYNSGGRDGQVKSKR